MRLDYAIFLCVCQCGPAPDGYRLLAPWTRHVHLTDARSSADYMTWQSTALLDGEIDWRGQLQALGDSSYDGYLTIETECPPLVRNSRINLARIRQMLGGLVR